MSISSFNTDIFYQAGSGSKEDQTESAFTLSKDRLNESIDNCVSVNSHLFSKDDNSKIASDHINTHTDDCSETEKLNSKLMDVHNIILDPGYMSLNKHLTGGSIKSRRSNHQPFSDRMSSSSHFRSSDTVSSSSYIQSESESEYKSESQSKSKSKSEAISESDNKSNSDSDPEIIYPNIDNISSKTQSSIQIPTNLIESESSISFRSPYIEDSVSNLSSVSNTNTKKKEAKIIQHRLDRQFGKKK